MPKAKRNPFPHGIDITAPGGLDALFAYHRARFGNATMEAGDGGAGGTGGGDGGEAGKGGDQGAGAGTGTGTGTGDQGKGGDQGKAGTDTTKAGDQGKGDVWDDPAAARAEIERLRRENGTDRVNAKTQAAEQAKNELIQSLGKTLGLVKDDNEKPDAAKLAQRLTDRDAHDRPGPARTRRLQGRRQERRRPRRTPRLPRLPGEDRGPRPD